MAGSRDPTATSALQEHRATLYPHRGGASDPQLLAPGNLLDLSKEIPGLIAFRMDWLDLLAVQGTLKSLLQHHSSDSCIA